MTWTTRPRSEVAGLAAIQRGEGPPVLLLHGVGLRAEAWAPQIDALSARYRVTALDLPGHGESALPARPMSLTYYSDAVLSAVTDPAVIIGHSMGAMIALDLACRVPERVRGVAALNAVFERDAKAAAAVQARAEALDGETPADPEPTLTRWFGNAETPARAACRDWLSTVSPAGYKSAYTAFAKAQGPDRTALARLACPALFITGALEPNSTPAMSRAMADLAPQGRAQIVEGAAHMMPMTHAAAVNAALLDFLQEVTP
ncbi:alpha/beta fold hydrolase [Marinovum sp.]|uniref:alpha/beta fold hydrolase n=1 Tax=Marinovum sp. TaxID=2024839 RepID=UPI003A94E314